jgi:glucose/mannose-6-phosphate isomerase
MRDRLAEIPDQCSSAWQKVSKFDIPSSYGQVKRVVVLGVGGSAIGGDLLRSLAALECKLPVFVNRDYDLPPFIDEHSLIIASSYSGNTEEVLSATMQALDRGCKVIAMTTGGELGKLARDNSLPTFTIDYSAPPRASLTYSTIALLGMMQRLDLISDKTSDVAEAADLLNILHGELGLSCPAADNPAKQLAKRLTGRLTIVYGGGHLAQVARRWKTQLNENAKSWAFFEVLPELNHNAVEGYGLPEELAQHVFVVLLDSPSLHPRYRPRLQVTTQVLNEHGIDHQTIGSRGESPLAQMLTTILFGDYVSYYLAILNQRDPSPVHTISHLKDQLRKM